MHLGNHVLEEEKRAVVDGREPCAEPARKTDRPVLTLDNVLLILPFDAERRVGHQVVKMLTLEAVPGLAVPEGVTEDDV